MFGKLFKRSKDVAYDEAAETQWDDDKTAFLESVLGKEHDMVSHAVIPFFTGGTLDLYYYPNGQSGTGIATKELVDIRGKGPRNRVYKAYELIVFTKQALNLEQADDATTPFGAIHGQLSTVLNLMARYAPKAKLNPLDTCEFPKDLEDVGGKCFIFDAYSPAESPGPKGMGLLLVMEVFRSEMDYARENGTDKLIQMLKDANHYPYSDLDREPVVPR